MVTETKATERVEEYLEAIVDLQEDSREFSVSALSQSLQVSPPSVSEMLKRLTQDGYLTTAGRGNFTLTPTGRALGEQIVRRHRLLERLLVDVLEMDWGLAHEEACRLEHGMSQQLEDRIDLTLNHPRTCPHGHPIPGEGGPSLPALTLADLAKGEEAIIRGIRGEEREFLRYLATMGFFPGARLRVEEIAPFGGIRIASLGSCRYSLGDDVARKILIERA